MPRQTSYAARSNFYRLSCPVKVCGLPRPRQTDESGDSLSLQNRANPAAHLSSECMTLLVYTTPWCGDCREAKRFLLQHGVPYTEINIETTPGAAEEVIARTGKRAVPQFVIDGKWVQPYQPEEGFLYEEMSELLGLSQPGAPAAEATDATLLRGPRS